MYCALHGGQDNPLNVHYWSWDFEMLKKDLMLAGFVNVKRYDRNKTEHANVRDWSLNYMPYRDKNGNILTDQEWFKGKFVALNVEANEPG